MTLPDQPFSVIDLRPPEEQQERPLPGTRHHIIPITLETIEDGGHALTPDLGPLLVACSRGNRAALAARYLRADGLNAQAWKDSIQALVDALSG